MTSASGSDSWHVGILWMVEFRKRALPVPPAPLVAATFQWSGPGEALSLSQAMGREDPGEVLQRFTAGKRCCVSRVGGTIATYGWATFDEEHIGELGLSIRMQPGEAYIWDCFTLPAYRGLRLYPALLAHMLHELAAEGLWRIWIGTDLDNIPSQKGVALVGCQPVLDVGITRVQTTSKLWMRPHSGASEQNAEAALRALSGSWEHWSPQKSRSSQ
jgi:ribosomal protein S18 acetylase RimI-like enzyme